MAERVIAFIFKYSIVILRNKDVRQLMIQTAEKVELMLKRTHLSITDSRKKILSLFLGQTGALSHGDIQKRAGDKD